MQLAGNRIENTLRFLSFSCPRPGTRICVTASPMNVTAVGMQGFGKSRVPGQGLHNKEQRRWETERSMWHLHLPFWIAHPTLKKTPSAKRCTLRDELTHAKAQCPCKRDPGHLSSAGQGLCGCSFLSSQSIALFLMHGTYSSNHLWLGTVATRAAPGMQPATSRTEEGSCSHVLFKI